jgi:hypothetical protein
MARGAEDRLGGLGVVAAGLDLGTKLDGGLVGRDRSPMRAGLTHCLVGVGGSEDPRWA